MLKLLATALMACASSACLGTELTLSYFVDRSDADGISTVTARLADSTDHGDFLIADCEDVSPYEIAQNQLLTNLVCDGDQVVATLTELGVQIVFRDEIVADIALPDGNYWINGLPLYIGR